MYDDDIDLPSQAEKTGIELIQVVRCKDCIHYRYYGLSEGTVSKCTIDHCENPDKEWFCADGKRQKGR